MKDKIGRYIEFKQDGGSGRVWLPSHTAPGTGSLQNEGLEASLVTTKYVMDQFWASLAAPVLTFCPDSGPLVHFRAILGISRLHMRCLLLCLHSIACWHAE
jgi:hypothetical protein